MESGLRMPSPTIPWEQAAPRSLLQHNDVLGYFASSPPRLAAHLMLAADPDRFRGVSEIVTGLFGAATPKVFLTPHQTTAVYRRTARAFRPARAERLNLVREGARTELGLSFAQSPEGQAATPAILLLAARWLLNRELTEKLLPASTTRPLHHGVRLACLQRCLSGGRSLDLIERELGLGRNAARSFFAHPAMSSVVAHAAGTATYRVRDAVRPGLEVLLAEMHSLADPAYADALRSEVMPQLLRTPGPYGVLAHAALSALKP